MFEWVLKFMAGVVCGIFIVASLTGCGTLGGAMQGAGEDLNKAGQWVRSR